MNYLSFLKSNLFLYEVLAALIILFLARLRDRDGGQGDIFDKQKWTLYDVLICLLIFDFSRIVYFFVFHVLNLSYLTSIIIFWLINAFSFYFVFKLKCRQSFAVLGLSKEGFWGNVFYGFKIALFLQLPFYGWLSFSPQSEKWLGFARVVYTRWFSYQNNLYAIGVLVVLFTLVPAFVEEFIFRGLMYSPIRKKTGKWGAILLTATMFVLYHGGLIPNLRGILLAYTYEMKRSLIPGIVLHTFIDICYCINFIYISDFLNLNYKVDGNGYARIMFLVCLVILLFILFFEKIYNLKQGRVSTVQQ